ncbi:MAG: DUF4150 domain-containing protein [Pseudomonadota bacterium]
MFQLTMGPGMNMAFPDVCKTPTPAGPVPIPYPNMSYSTISSPAPYTITVDAMPVLNQLSKGMVSVGDQPGVLLGLVDQALAGQTIYTLGCFTIFAGGAPAQRLTSLTGQNAMGMIPNAPGMCAVPSQVTVLTLG